ncbi:MULTISPECIES: bifunctional (p)ppGpp synthetase/guanosine-3',5'-bis(diphosphate) 3'-pyrophosphohydrolase [Tepidanaerobacter]|uniref:GTP diphosphokinase n=1 Tax=Tepidanaerobacter syntrophicus TaxID=224999 RepID=A0A0U9HIV2_9FIRM|nr:MULTISPECIES: bifunctional (p)ppGpp synthetase/guanosine-3',5'-bis(diphosphate) 3'-pyrophosphohydrolase [Tepidanaerobacter]GAQ26091.1 GTP pyrophosphokinase [Tepidanaerobacter syntrophicus]GLI19593.1 (p)ppGpp synthetase [Tepidanaerobacter syntrophicus]HHV82083.1 bifunctional (p)ppGpp synthetase/guanosine-3',5'-bis(diphosphate) 3'-pyrophosphohydrolase [Tepidanaerobacter syntrophicus]
MNFDSLEKQILSYSPSADINIVRKAYEFAKEAHGEQRRVSGELFISHPLGVAKILADLELDVPTIAAGLLHDVVEDTSYTIEDIEKNFGSEIATLVDGVTKLGKLEYKTKEEQQAENLRKMFFAMAKDIRIILIKLADRLHNMRTLKSMPEDKQKEKAMETLEIFAPLAHRLGISAIKWELEDLAFRYLEPEKYYELVEKVAKKRQEREKHINEMIAILKEKLSAAGIEADIQGRPKHFYSIYKKMKDQNKTFEQIYDLTAVRVIVDTVKDCYGALGVVHSLWKPIPGRFKDYIAMPKPNMYQSLHTTVIDSSGDPLEIQIRTYEMHKTAEYGIAAHWRYKEGGKDSSDFEQKLSWLREILDWQRELRDAKDFMENLKIDLFTDEVYVFTPKGDVIDLPMGSCPIDFAYRIHTDIGNKCVGAKVNEKMVPLDYKLANGDIVEIITSSHSPGPSRDWLNIVKSPQAKNKIRQWFKKERREENIARGKDMLEKEGRRQGYDIYQLMKLDFMNNLLKKMSFANIDDMYAAIGYGAVTTKQILQKILEEYKKSTKLKQETIIEKVDTKAKKKKNVDHGIKIDGVDNLLVKFSRCCNPVPGDKIVGYITRGRGVSIHRQDCKNVARGDFDKDRLIDVKWEGFEETSYPVEIQASAHDRPGILSEVINLVSDMKTNIDAINARTTKDGVAVIDMILEINNKQHLENVMQKIKKINGIYSIRRVMNQ